MTATVIINDESGNEWERCGPDCDLNVVRPGKAQCNYTADQCPNAHACLACGHSYAPWMDQCPHCGADPREELAALDTDPMGM